MLDLRKPLSSEGKGNSRFESFQTLVRFLRNIEESCRMSRDSSVREMSTQACMSPGADLIDCKYSLASRIF